MKKLYFFLVFVIVVFFAGFSSFNTNKIFAQEFPSSIQLTPDIDKFLKELEKLNEIEPMWNAPRQNAIILRMLVEMIHAKNALEIGTSNGYSAIWIGLGLQSFGGHLTSLEIDGEMVKMARENLKKAGLSKTVSVIEGDALNTIKELDGPFDFVFIDARRSEYYDYFKLIYPKVEKGGIIVAHNAIVHADDIKDYLDGVSELPELISVIVSTGHDGIMISYKTK